MEGITLTTGGRQLLFATDGTVADSNSQNPLGAWRSQSDQKDNQVRYTIGGADQTPLPAIYSFNGTNQLQMQLRAADGKLSDPFVFIGGIEIDDKHNLNYVLTDNTGAPTGQKITVYGNLQFAQDTNNLAIALTGGGQTAIQGLNGVTSLQAEKNHIAAFKADDLLTFQAETDNEIPGQEDLVVIPAKIQFARRLGYSKRQPRLPQQHQKRTRRRCNQYRLRGETGWGHRGLRLFCRRRQNAGRTQHHRAARVQGRQSADRLVVGILNRIHREDVLRSGSRQ